MILRRCALAAAVLIALSDAPLAEPCLAVTDVTRRLTEDADDAEILIAEGAIADRITTGISTVIGDVVPRGGSYVLAQRAADPLTYIVRFLAGCATHHGRFPRQLVRSWIEGQAAENRKHD